MLRKQTVENSAPDPGVSRPKPGANPNDSTLNQRVQAAQQASNEVATARLSNQEGTGVQEWQTPVRPTNTPNVRQAARSEQAIQQGQTLRSNGPTDTPQWQSSATTAPPQEVSRLGQSLQAAGVKSDNAPLADQARERMQTELDQDGKNGQTSGGESRLDAVAQQKANLPSAPSESPYQQR